MEFKEGEQIKIPKTERFLESCKKISDYIVKMGFPDEFMYLLLEHTDITRVEAFKSGVDLGIKLVLDTSEELNKTGGRTDERFN